jgi:ankyrin repeat protein
MLIDMPEKTLRAILPAMCPRVSSDISNRLTSMTHDRPVIMPVQQGLMEQMSRYLSAIMPIEKNDEVYPLLHRLVGPDATATIEVLKLTVYLLSNNLLPGKDERLVCGELLEWFRLGDNHLLLKAILSHRLPTIEALAEGIFASALEAEDQKMAKLFLDLDMSADITIFDRRLHWFSTALQFVTERDNFGLVDLLLNSGASVDLAVTTERATNTQTPLQIAARNENMEIAQLLIDRGAKVNGFNKSGLSAIQNAAMGGNSKLVEMLLGKGADINAQTTVYGCPLERAIRYQAISVAEMLLERGAHINGRNGSCANTPLQSAAMVDDHDMVLSLLDLGVDANTSAPKWVGNNLEPFWEYNGSRPSKTALQWAAKNGNLSICQVLMDAGADPNAAPGTSYNEKDGATALVAALTSGNDQVVELLLKHGADVNDERGSQTALETATGLDDEKMLQLILCWNPGLGNSVIHAVEKQDFMLVSTLLEAGADINAVDPENGRSALSAAVDKNDIGLVRYLLKEGANPSPKSGRNSTRGGSYLHVPLVAAARLGNLDVIDILLLAGADCNQQGKSYILWDHFATLNALQAAAAKGNINVVRHLLEAGAELNGPAEREYGLTAMQAAVQSGNLELIHSMIHQGAELNSSASEFGFTALHAAVQRRDEGLVQVLLDYGATANDAPGMFQSGHRQLNSLQMAAANGDNDLIRRLLRHGANINWPAADAHGRTALQAAAEFGRESTVRLLIAEGADVNAPAGRFRGLTALQAAAKGGFLCIADILLRKGASVNAPRGIESGLTAIEAASWHGRIDMLKLLLNAGADITSDFGRSQLESALSRATQRGHNSAAKFLKYHQIC